MKRFGTVLIFFAFLAIVLLCISPGHFHCGNNPSCLVTDTGEDYWAPINVPPISFLLAAFLILVTYENFSRHSATKPSSPYFYVLNTSKSPIHLTNQVFLL